MAFQLRFAKIYEDAVLAGDYRFYLLTNGNSAPVIYTLNNTSPLLPQLLLEGNRLSSSKRPLPFSGPLFPG